MDNERFGETVSLSNDGGRLMVASGAGVSTAYQWNRAFGSWDRMGGAFLANASARACISGDGRTIAVGVMDTDANLEPGHVEVFQWISSDKVWHQMGSRIEGNVTGNITGFGRTLSLSQDGKTLSVTSNSSYVAVFRWNSLSSSWDSRGSTDISNSLHAGLSGDGRVLVARTGVYALSCDASWRRTR